MTYTKPKYRAINGEISHQKYLLDLSRCIFTWKFLRSLSSSNEILAVCSVRDQDRMRQYRLTMDTLEVLHSSFTIFVFLREILKMCCEPYITAIITQRYLLAHHKKYDQMSS